MGQNSKAPSPIRIGCETAIANLMLAVDARATAIRSDPHKREEAEHHVGECRRLLDRAIDLVAAEARDAVHHRLTELVDRHFGTRPTKPVEELLDVLEDELAGLAPQAREDALLEAVEQCESEKRACAKLAERFPKNAVHATGVLIADVCARRVRTLLGEDDANSEETER